MEKSNPGMAAEAAALKAASFDPSRDPY